MVTSGFYLEMNFDRIDTKIERGGIMDKIEIVIVTGMSGAGKTTAMAAFENMAYCCIDNYPIALLGAFSEFLKDNTNYKKNIIFLKTHRLTIPKPSLAAFIKHSIQIGCGNAIAGSATFSPDLNRCCPALASNFAGVMNVIPFLLIMI